MILSGGFVSESDLQVHERKMRRSRCYAQRFRLYEADA
jgi:hypothetical protein